MKRSSPGFSLVEVLVATAVMTASCRGKRPIWDVKFWP